MSNVTRDVIVDLWPVYEAGEASPDTRTLVEQFLAADRELESILRRASASTRRAFHASSPEAARATAAERSAVEATRARLFRQRWLLAAAIGTTLVPFAVVFGGEGGPRMLAEDYPAIWALLLVGAAAWAKFWHSTKSL